MFKHIAVQQIASNVELALTLLVTVPASFKYFQILWGQRGDREEGVLFYKQQMSSPHPDVIAGVKKQPEKLPLWSPTYFKIGDVRTGQIKQWLAMIIFVAISSFTKDFCYHALNKHFSAASTRMTEGGFQKKVPYNRPEDMQGIHTKERPCFLRKGYKGRTRQHL